MKKSDIELPFKLLDRARYGRRIEPKRSRRSVDPAGLGDSKKDTQRRPVRTPSRDIPHADLPQFCRDPIAIFPGAQGRSRDARILPAWRSNNEDDFWHSRARSRGKSHSRPGEI